MGQFFFRPDPIRISVGDRVRWTNTDIPHTVTSGSPGNETGIFDSGVLPNAGDTFSYTFNSTGTFAYFCSIHPDLMRGTVVVSG